MIISHKHKFIFVKTRKTAGTSVEIALSTICGDQDVLTPLTPEDERIRIEHGGRPAQHYWLSPTRWKCSDIVRACRKREFPQYNSHMSAADIRSHVGEEIWRSYFTFTLDRNPYDRLISFYYWHGGPNVHGSFSDYVLRQGGWSRSVNYELYADRGFVIVDAVYRYEDLPGMLRSVASRLGLSKTPALPYQQTKRSSDRTRDYQEYYTEETRTLVSVACAREIALLGYQF